MKKIYFFVFSVLLCTAGMAQGSMIELMGTGTMSGQTTLKTVGGGGFGMGLYSEPINLLRSRGMYYAAKKGPSKLALRFGGDAMINFMGSKTFKHVPLLTESGNAKVDVSNTMYNINTGARLSTSAFDGKLIPYLDLSIGYRYLSSSMDIYPDDKEKQTTYKSLETVGGFSTEIGAGALICLGKEDDFFLNLGVALNHSGANGKFVDMSRVTRINNTIDYYTRPSIDDYVMFRVGIVAMLDFRDEGGSSGHTCGAGIHSGYHGSHCGGGHSSVSVHAH